MFCSLYSEHKIPILASVDGSEYYLRAVCVSDSKRCIREKLLLEKGLTEGNGRFNYLFFKWPVHFDVFYIGYYLEYWYS